MHRFYSFHHKQASFHHPLFAMMPLNNHPITLTENLISTVLIYANKGAKNNINIANHLGEYLSAG